MYNQLARIARAIDNRDRQELYLLVALFFASTALGLGLALLALL